MINEYLGEVHIEIQGDDLSGLDNEPGGHRIQRVPPTERKGRVHTSTVTVAVVSNTEIEIVSILESELKVEWYSGTGAGGQYRNKHQNSCRITHIPTGTVAKSECRSRSNSYNEARSEIEKRISAEAKYSFNKSVSLDRKNQVGSGMRGDKIRTYRFQDDRVVDHQTNKTAKCGFVLKGNFDSLWK